jgi:hypothetical protein
MWIEKLAHGVLELDTPIGPRYLQPNFSQRLQLLWTFRNFVSLPHQVLRVRERELVDRLCADNKFVSRSTAGNDLAVIGRIERRVSAATEILPTRKPAASSRGAVAEEGREAASA